MNKPISFQTILGADGSPAFVVVPYDEFVNRFEQAGDLVPHAVVELVIEQGLTPVKAWRTHLKLTQGMLGERMGISQSAYAQLEASSKLRKSSREKIARAMGISEQQLDV